MDYSFVEEILYDDEEIRVIWSPGSSKFVLITFGDLVTPARDHLFFADVPLKKSGIAAIGIMAKHGNWYPSKYLHNAAGFILNKIGGYRTRVTYGGSMGSYAAIKFSRLLGATHVIALCPQWSIDPAECKETNSGWIDHFIPTMSGMGIRAQDVAGEVFLFADEYHASDMFHSRMIIENYPDAHFVKVPMVGHHVTTVFAGTGNLLDLIDACRACDVAALREFSRRTRKNHPVRRDQILPHAMQKLPRLGLRLLLDANNRDLLRTNWRFFPQILSHLASTVGTGPAIAFYKDFRSLLLGLTEQHLICAYLAGITGGQVAVATTHLSWLIYDLSENRVLHKDAPLDPWEIPVEVELLNFAAALFVTVGGTKFHLSVNDEGWLGISAIKGQGDEGFLFEIEPSENGRLIISHGGQHLSAEPGGRMICDRDKALDWEMFRFDCYRR